jgi:2-hydroxy-4-carboxymuconate semialdehyde hemiacetal dehydrogenase
MIGYGSIAQMHVRAVKAAGETLYSVTGRLPERSEAFAREFGFLHAEPDLERAVAAPEVDAVLITSPSEMHAEHTEIALRAGKHVLCEIPLAMSLHDIDRLADLANQMDRRLMVCHTQRYLPAFAKAREAIASGRLHPHHIIYRYGFMRRENVNWLGRRRSWTDNLLWHHGCHIVDTSLWLLGEKEVAVDAHLAKPGKDLGIPMDLSMVLRTRNDQLVTVGMSYNTKVQLGDCLIIGEEETYHVDEERLSDSQKVLHEPGPEGDMFSVAIAAQDREFIQAVREGREPALSPREVRPTMAVLQTAQDQYDAWLRPGDKHPIP